MGVLHAWMSVHHMLAWCLRRPERVVRPPRTSVRDCFKLPCGCGEQSLFPGRRVSALNHRVWPPVFLCFSEIHTCICRCVTYQHFDMSTPVFCNKNYKHKLSVFMFPIWKCSIVSGYINFSYLLGSYLMGEQYVTQEWKLQCIISILSDF